MIDERIRVEIVAPVHNRKDITLKCLKSLSRLNTTGLDVHVVIVDDGSSDGTSEAIAAQFPEVEVVQGDGNLWYTEGTNVGVRAGLKHDPAFVLMINDDAVFDQDFLVFMVETARKHERSIVGSLLMLWDTPHKLFQIAPVWDTWYGDWRHWSQQTVWTVPNKPWNVDLIVGNCVLVPVGAFAEGGLMDSKKYPNFGDAVFTPKLKRLGWKLLIDPRARVFCLPNTIPPRVKKMGLKKALKVLVTDLGNGHNLRRRLYAYLEGAPSKLVGFVGFCVFLVRAGVTKSYKTVSDAPEPPLNKTFASAVVDD
ncbi:MAG TPA: glycosyltransferase family 2 protein [Pyrinomonadaceae bacterium]|nr:glycosyltransferase family 2 protein [Acidobacteriota bacterium]HQZ97818.1 glycosyltransferase family 2 protein [Pyrinomonadaceae bacterium]